MNKTAAIISGIFAIAVVGGIAYAWKFDDWVKIPKAREAVQSKLRDPASAQFRNERFVAQGAFCGEVNSKNAMGGYVGFKKFISMSPTENYVEGSGRLEEASTDDFIARMDKEIAIMRRFNANKFEHPPQDQITQLAISEIFDDKWAELCGNA